MNRKVYGLGESIPAHFAEITAGMVDQPSKVLVFERTCKAYGHVFLSTLLVSTRQGWLKMSCSVVAEPAVNSDSVERLSLQTGLYLSRGYGTVAVLNCAPSAISQSHFGRGLGADPE